VQSGYRLSDGSYSWGELPSSVVACTSGSLCTASIPQSIGDAYYRLIHRNSGGSTILTTNALKARAN
jgi:hypothetical protein